MMKLRTIGEGLKARATWLGGLWAPWVLVWLLMGLRMLVRAGSKPHPFLPDVSYATGMLRHAVMEWGLHALLAHLVMGLVCGFIALVWLQVGRKVAMDLTFRKGLAMGAGTVLLFHGLLYLAVPGALQTVDVLRRIPYVLLLPLLLGGGWALVRAAFHQEGVRFRGWKALGAGLCLGGLLLVPHGSMRRLAPHPEAVPAASPRLLVLGIDGLRKDVLEEAMPAWAAPGGCEPVSIIPATRLAWNILMGGDPGQLTHSYVIPYRSEWTDANRHLKLPDIAQQKGLAASFLIDDSTTLSFGLVPTSFYRVVEPAGGWKHFFTMGLGSTWPVYSWLENYVSPVETTNPWSSFGATLQDVGRSLNESAWLSAHSCHLHAPFYLTLAEIQDLDRWAWVFRPASAFQSYQDWDSAARNHFARCDERADPVRQYEVRARLALRELAPFVAAWEARFPNLSGVVTSDHGEQFHDFQDPATGRRGHFTGVHGFNMEPSSIRIPLHPIGRTQSLLGQGDVYSWGDLRDGILQWIQTQEPLRLEVEKGDGRILQFPAVKADHLLAPDEVAKGMAGGGISAEDLVFHTFLLDTGAWYLADPQPGTPLPTMSMALVKGIGMVTFNPVGKSSYVRGAWRGYTCLQLAPISAEAMAAEIEAFDGRRIRRLGARKP